MSTPSTASSPIPSQPPRHLSFVTGHSRGMGLALAEQLLSAGHHVIGVSRKAPDALTEFARRAGAPLEQWAMDLADPAAAAQRLHTWLTAQGPSPWSSVTLINNAGVIARPVPLADGDADDLLNALRVGLEAPMLLTSAFLRATAGWAIPRRVLNISSGLGRHPLASASAYCAAKAGMDHFTRCVALEESRLPNGAKVCSLAPGVIDTDMQVDLRSGDPAHFPACQNFIDMKEKGMLSSPHDAAKRLLDYLARPNYGENPVADVRDPA